MNKKEYSELIKRPEWQKKRIRILQRDMFRCIKCGVTKKKLHVHHLRYTEGGMPWDSLDDDLVTLCEKCHAIEHGRKPPKPNKKPTKSKMNRGKIRHLCNHIICSTPKLKYPDLIKELEEIKSRFCKNKNFYT